MLNNSFTVNIGRGDYFMLTALCLGMALLCVLGLLCKLLFTQVSLFRRELINICLKYSSTYLLVNKTSNLFFFSLFFLDGC